MKFTKGARLKNMVIYYTLTLWCCYIAQMHGRPKANADSCQKLLYYLLMNPSMVVACWRKRQQLYSSATFFDVVGADLKAWINGDAVDENDEEAVRKHEYEVRILFFKYTFVF